MSALVSAAVRRLRAALANDASASEGPALVRYDATRVYPRGSIGDKLRRVISPMDPPWNAAGDGVTLDDVPLATVVAVAKVGGFDIELGNRLYAISAPWVIDSGSSINVFSRGAALIGPAAGALNALLEVKDWTDWNLHGRLGIVGRYNPDLVAGVWIHADAAASCSLINIDSLAFSGCKLAYRIGDTATPDKTVSEINIFGGYTYGCPNVLRAEGTQTVVNFSNPTINSDSGTGDAAWQALTQTTVQVLGGHVSMTGGEVNHASNASGAAFNVQPVASVAYGNPFGSISCVNVRIETAAQLATATNPGAIAAPGGVPIIEFDRCGGYHPADSFPFIQTDADWTGEVRVAGGHFRAGVARSQPNIQCANPAAHVYCDENSFGQNFLGQLHGITGGIAHFAAKLILSATTPAAQVIPSNTLTTVVYGSVGNGGDLNRFLANFNAATGVFTVPAGGLKDVLIKVGHNSGAAVSADVYLVVNGVIGKNAMSMVSGGLVGMFKSLNAGDTVRVQVQPSGAPITLNGALNHFEIFASC